MKRLLPLRARRRILPYNIDFSFDYYARPNEIMNNEIEMLLSRILSAVERGDTDSLREISFEISTNMILDTSFDAVLFNALLSLLTSPKLWDIDEMAILWLLFYNEFGKLSGEQKEKLLSVIDAGFGETRSGLIQFVLRDILERKYTNLAAVDVLASKLQTRNGRTILNALVGLIGIANRSTQCSIRDRVRSVIVPLQSNVDAKVAKLVASTLTDWERKME